jgi:Ca2+-transporting ATPase
MVAAGITFLAYALSTPRDPADLELAIGILGVVLLHAVIGFAQQHAAERTAEALQGNGAVCGARMGMRESDH